MGNGFCDETDPPWPFPPRFFRFLATIPSRSKLLAHELATE